MIRNGLSSHQQIDQGYTNMQRWIDNSRGRITTQSGQDLADAVLRAGSLDWFRAALDERP